MKNTIKVTIEATAGAGKSCLAFAIANLLKEQGIECSISGCEDEYPGAMEASWRDRFATLAKSGRAVEITTRQLRRGGTSSLHNV